MKEKNIFCFKNKTLNRYFMSLKQKHSIVLRINFNLKKI